MSISEISTLTRDQRLLESRTLFLSEAVDSSTARRFVSDLLFLAESDGKKPIFLYVNSPGGEINSGFAIYDVIRYISCPVNIVSAGLCASIATIINIAVPKERRYSLPNSRFLIHQPLISGTVTGPASDLEITATQILQTRERINQLLAEACGQDVERVTRDTERDYWMSAQESLSYGLIGEIVSSRAEIG